MRVFLDTNVLLAALLKPDGVCASVVAVCADRHTPLTSSFVLDELRLKLIGKFKRSPPDVEFAVRAFLDRFAVTDPGEITVTLCRDPNDNAVLAAAHAGQADCLVTGDKDLLTLRVFEGVAIISPSSFHAFEQSRLADE